MYHERWGSRVEANADRALLGASLAFAGATVLGSAVAIRDQLPGEPFGVSVPLSVPVGVLAGWGAGIAAPWPMPIAAVIAAAPAQREPDAFPGTVCAGDRPGVHIRHAHRTRHPPATVLVTFGRSRDRPQRGSLGRSHRSRSASSGDRTGAAAPQWVMTIGRPP
jgi:hypothetical protein